MWLQAVIVRVFSMWFQKAFKPTLPNDVSLSFYVQAQKLVLAVYQLYINNQNKVDIHHRFQVRGCLMWLKFALGLLVTLHRFLPILCPSCCSSFTLFPPAFPSSSLSSFSALPILPSLSLPLSSFALTLFSFSLPPHLSNSLSLSLPPLAFSLFWPLYLSLLHSVFLSSDTLLVC